VATHTLAPQTPSPPPPSSLVGFKSHTSRECGRRRKRSRRHEEKQKSVLTSRAQRKKKEEEEEKKKKGWVETTTCVAEQYIISVCPHSNLARVPQYSPSFFGLVA
jgi:hypothetical protein